MKESKSFTSDKLDWLDQVVSDRKLRDFSFKVAYAIAQHINAESKIAYPGHARLATLLGASRRGIQKAISDLKQRNHLEVSSRTGRGHVNEYRMKRANVGSPFRTQRANSCSVKSERVFAENTLSNTTTDVDNEIAILFAVGGVEIESDRSSIPMVSEWIKRAQEYIGFTNPIQNLKHVIGYCRSKSNDCRSIRTMNFYRGAVEDALAQRIC